MCSDLVKRRATGPWGHVALLGDLMNMYSAEFVLYHNVTPHKAFTPDADATDDVKLLILKRGIQQIWQNLMWHGTKLMTDICLVTGTSSFISAATRKHTYPKKAHCQRPEQISGTSHLSVNGISMLMVQSNQHTSLPCRQQGKHGMINANFLRLIMKSRK